MAIFSLVFSGGTTNQDPELSLGGPPSSFPVPMGLSNNLFPDFTGRDVALASTDYRCVYIFNDSDDTLLGVTVWVSEQFDDGADADLGFSEADEEQQFSVQGDITGGTFTLTVEEMTTDAIAWHPDMPTTAVNIKDALRQLDGLGDVVCETTGTNIFKVTFTGGAGLRRRGLISANIAGLTYPETDDPPVSSVIVLTPGSPINTVAPLIDSASTLPPGVTFSLPIESSPKTIGDLAPGEGFPIWVRRQVTIDSQPTATDGLKIKVSGDRLLT